MDFRLQFIWSSHTGLAIPEQTNGSSVRVGLMGAEVAWETPLSAPGGMQTVNLRLPSPLPQLLNHGARPLLPWEAVDLV